MAFDPPDLGSDAKAVLSVPSDLRVDHDLAVTLELLPVDNGVRKRMVGFRKPV